MSNHTPTTDFAPLIEQIADLPCRCCLQKTLQSFVQPPPVPTAAAHLYVHCTNADCKLWYVTREYNDWLTFDLSVWGAAQHPDWRAPGGTSSIRALVETYIVERENPIADLVLRDFREQYRTELPYTRHAFCARWLRLYTGAAS